MKEAKIIESSGSVVCFLPCPLRLVLFLSSFETVEVIHLSFVSQSSCQIYLSTGKYFVVDHYDPFALNI